LIAVKMPRHEWLKLCKADAREHIGAGDLEGGVVSFMQLLGQHPDTFDLIHFEGATGWELAQNRDEAKLRA
jgi:hypothetical protein